MLYTGDMAKKSKKLTKRYSGEDAKAPSAPAQTVIHRYEAVERNAAQEWWHGNKRLVKVVGYTAGGLTLFGWLLFELLQIIF